MGSEYIAKLDREISALERELVKKRQERAFIMTTAVPNAVGDRVKRTRLIKDLSASQLGARAGVLTEDVLKLESGRSYKKDLVKKIADALGVSYQYLNSGVYANQEEAESLTFAENGVGISEMQLTDLKWDYSNAVVTRTVNALRRAGLSAINDIIETPPKQIMKTRSFGMNCFKCLKEALINSNIPLTDEWELAAV